MNMSFRRSIIVRRFLALLPFLAAGTPTCAQSVPISSALATRQDVAIPAIGLGTVRPFNSVTVTARVDGQITSIGFQEGQDVKKGDILAELDQAPLQAALAQAEAVQGKDEALLGNARLDLDRAQRLIATGAATTQQLDTARSQVAQLQAAVKADQASVQAARTQLAYTRITAPIAGRAGTRLIDAGNIVRAGGTVGIVTINQIKPITVEFDLPADSLPAVKLRMSEGPLQAEALDRSETLLATGELTVIDNQVNVSTNTVKFKASFANAEESLWPGQSVTVRLITKILRDALTIPVTAVNRGPGNLYTFVVDATQHAQKRPISVGYTNKTLAVIESGLNDGERVVTDGQYRIVTGTQLTLTSAGPEAATANAP